MHLRIVFISVFSFIILSYSCEIIHFPQRVKSTPEVQKTTSASFISLSRKNCQEKRSKALIKNVLYKLLWISLWIIITHTHTHVWLGLCKTPSKYMADMLCLSSFALVTTIYSLFSSEIRSIFTRIPSKNI